MMTNQHALDIQNLSKRYGKLQALDNVNLQITAGDFFVLLGPNGAGKSTLIRTITSLAYKDEGQLLAFGKDLTDPQQDAKRLFGVVPQEINLFPLEKVKNILVAQAGYYGIPRKEAWERAQHLLGAFGLLSKANQTTKALSGGMKRRVMIIRALIHAPKLLILDEPTEGIDVEARYQMWEFLRKLNQSGTTILLTTHNLEEAEKVCKNLAVINHGRVVEQMSVARLGEKISHDVFGIELINPFMGELNSADYQITKIDDLNFEVSVCSGQDLNALFHFLDKKGVKVAGIERKVNKLERVFLQLVGE